MHTFSRDRMFNLLLSNRVLTFQQAIHVRVFIAKVVNVQAIWFCVVSDSLILWFFKMDRVSTCRILKRKLVKLLWSTNPYHPHIATGQRFAHKELILNTVNLSFWNIKHFTKIQISRCHIWDYDTVLHVSYLVSSVVQNFKISSGVIFSFTSCDSKKFVNVRYKFLTASWSTVRALIGSSQMLQTSKTENQWQNNVIGLDSILTFHVNTFHM
jgi:hypothetical protein